MARITDHRDPRERRRHRAPEVDHLAAAVRLDLSLQEMRARDVAAGTPARGEDEPPTGLIDLNAIRSLLGQPTTGDVDPAAAAWLAGGADPAAARVVEEVDYLDQIAQAQPALAATSIREHFDEQLAAAVAAINTTADQHAALELTADALADVEYRDLGLVTAAVAAPDGTWVPLAAGPEYDCEVLGNAFHTAPCGDLQHPPVTLEVPPPIDHEHVPRLDGSCALCGGRLEPLERVFSSEQPRGGWRSRHDPRSLQFGVRRQLTAAPLADRLWFPGAVGDQGAEGACVGWGIVDAVNARAAGDTDLTAADAHALFARADVLDGDGLTGRGTSVLAGLQAGVERGLFGGYLWCFGTRDVAQAVLQRGPVVVGVPWLSGMYDTGPGGLVQLAGDDTGAGHCLAVVGIMLRGPQGQPGPFFVWQNSWGPDYGDGGLGYIHHRDLATLLHGVGEAAVPTMQAQS